MRANVLPCWRNAHATDSSQPRTFSAVAGPESRLQREGLRMGAAAEGCAGGAGG